MTPANQNRLPFLTDRVRLQDGRTGIVTGLIDPIKIIVAVAGGDRVVTDRRKASAIC